MMMRVWGSSVIVVVLLRARLQAYSSSCLVRLIHHHDPSAVDNLTCISASKIGTGATVILAEAPPRHIGYIGRVPRLLWLSLAECV
jgi:hypothetical protein